MSYSEEDSESAWCHCTPQGFDVVISTWRSGVNLNLGEGKVYGGRVYECWRVASAGILFVVKLRCVVRCKSWDEHWGYLKMSRSSIIWYAERICIYYALLALLIPFISRPHLQLNFLAVDLPTESKEWVFLWEALYGFFCNPNSIPR